MAEGWVLTVSQMQAYAEEVVALVSHAREIGWLDGMVEQWRDVRKLGVVDEGETMGKVIDARDRFGRVGKG